MDAATEAIREDIHRTAAARAEATVYSLTNSYLTAEQKSQIEAVYQFPIGVSHYALAYLVLAMDWPLWDAWLAASGISVVAWLLARFLPGRLFWPIGLLFGGNFSTLACLILAAASAYVGHYWAAAYLALASFGITAFVEVPVWLWSAASRRMNPKYLIAKRMFGLTFPFEEHLD